MFAFLMFVFTVSSLTHGEHIANLTRDQDDYCLLPPYPDHGRYTVSKYPSARPGEIYSNVKMDIYCDTGYLLNNTIKSILCVNGYWSASMPICVRDLNGFCTLPSDDPSVMYHCLSYPGTHERSWECESLVSTGTLVIPIRRFPSHLSLEVLPDMHCRNGTWDYNHISKPAACGLTTQHLQLDGTSSNRLQLPWHAVIYKKPEYNSDILFGSLITATKIISSCGLTTQHLQLEGTSSNHLQLPWHAVIYNKSSEYYDRVCAGSLITATKIISSAIYFLNEKNELHPTSEYLVAMNKMYNSYNDTRDRNIQYSDIAEIKIPSSYRGKTTHYEDNIAIVVVKTTFFLHLSVRPVCLDFDTNHDRTQMTKGNTGKTICSLNTGDNGQSSKLLYAVDYTYMDLGDCKDSSNRQFNLSKDKFCASCDKDSSFTYPGSGLVSLEPTTQRYFLRGVNSEYYKSEDGRININMFTSIVKHEHFIKQHL